MSTLLLTFSATLLFGVGSVMVSKLKKAKALHQCREAALDTQEILAKSLSELFRRNNQAEHLEYENRKWTRRVAMAPTPPDKAAATSMLLKIISQQIQLSMNQKRIMAAGRLQALYRAGVWQRTFSPNSSVSKPKLAVIPTMTSIAPPYMEVPEFEREQAIEFTIREMAEGKNWIECGATITKENQKWKVKLNKVKSLWNRQL